jgi:glycogen synthase
MQTISKPDRTIIFVTFETAISKYGGLGAVMAKLPVEVGKTENCIILAPFFHRMINLPKLKASQKVKNYNIIFSLIIPVKGRVFAIDVIKVIQRIKESGNDLITYLISSDYFFSATPGPYINPCNPDHPLDPYRNPNNSEKLTEDALFFCSTVPHVLSELIKSKQLPSRNIILHLQDWETASVVHALKKHSLSPAIQCSCVLTLHNPYDKGINSLSSHIVTDLVQYLNMDNDSILYQSISILPRPISTVSKNFAEELLKDPLQTYTFAPHLQGIFHQKGIIGINNGNFEDLEFPEEIVHSSPNRRIQKILAEKQRRRNQIVDVFNHFQSTKAWGKLDDLSNFTGPVFLTFGRDDSRQKGYDVLAQAIRNIAKGKAKFIFTPMPGDEGLVGLQFLKNLAEERKGDIIVLPFRMEWGYKQIQQGASFIILPSLYEPFGGAIEGYAVGTPVIARQTGGLVQQICPHPGENSTGFLFRENVNRQEQIDGWKKIMACDYWNQDPKGDRIEDRMNIPLYQEMVKKAAECIGTAIDFYNSDPKGYARMILNGFEMLGHFDWAKTCQEYQMYFYS